MARRGENIYKRKDNRWEGRYIKGYDSSGKAKFGYVYSRTYREVKEKLTAAKRAVCETPAVNERDLAFYCDEWLFLSRNRIKASSYAKYYNIVERHIKPRLGECLPQKLDDVAVESFSGELLSAGLAPKSVRDILTVLKSVMKYCKRILGTEFTDIEPVYPRENRKEMRVLSIEEQNRFVQYLLTDTDTVKFGVLLALLTGMRIGEVCALRWGDISLEDKILRICSTMQRLQIPDSSTGTKTKIIIGEAKTETSKRVIPLTEYALSLCRRMKASSDSAYVLTGETCRFIEPRTLQYRLKKYTAECGLDGVHFHVLRHTFATRCIEVGFEIKTLSEILGHSSVKVTLDRYVHSSLELKRFNMDKLAAVGL